MVTESNLNIEQMRKALENKSGYPFELEIVRRLEACEYLTEPNYSFEDHDTGMARELDFRALNVMPISSKKGEFAFVVILGSCKDNKNPYVFFTRKTILSGITLSSDVPIAGCPLEIYDENGDKDAIQWYLGLHDFLHIATTDNVSSQFCELVRKNNKWEVQSEVIFKNAFIPLVKALSREIEDYNKACIPSKNETSPNYQIYYPLLVLKGPLLEYHVPPEGPAQLREAKHILVIRHYESRTVKCEYAIDVIHESYLEQYLDLVEKEVTKFVNRVRHHKKIIVESIKKLAGVEEEKQKPKLD